MTKKRTVVALRELLYARSIIGWLLHNGASGEDYILGVGPELSIRELATKFRADTKRKYMTEEPK
jgi:hypothetical protein